MQKKKESECRRNWIEMDDASKKKRLKNKKKAKNELIK